MCNLSAKGIAIVIGSLVLSGAAWAEPPELFLPVATPKAAQAVSQAAPQAVKFNAEALLGLPEGQEARITLPGRGTFPIVHDRTEWHPNGDVTWVGHFRDYGTDYRVVVTSGPNGASGRISSPDGVFSLTPGGGNDWLLDLKRAGFQAVPLPPDDGRALPSAYPRAQSPSGSPAAAVPPAGPSVISLMFVYTPGMVQRYGTGLQTRLNNLVAIANQAYIDSGINMSLRLVHSVKVDYSETNLAETALDDLTYGAGSFSGIPALRARYGADLVQLIRPFYVSADVCGIAWINSAIPEARYGYSVVEDGTDMGGSLSNCDDITFPHELGHNMGAAHDRAHAASPGAYDYSYGYGAVGLFATVMAAGYIEPAPPVAKFSNPATTCDAKGDPCGVAENLPNSANNALTLNNTRAAIAAFFSLDPKECLFDWAEKNYSTLFSPAGATTVVWSVYTYRYYSATNAYVGVSSTDNHIYYIGPDGNWQDQGPLSYWLPKAGCEQPHAP